MKKTKENLADILREMADYVESNGPEEGYFEEIVGSGLFHDAIGEVVSMKNGVVEYVTEY